MNAQKPSARVGKESARTCAECPKTAKKNNKLKGGTRLAEPFPYHPKGYVDPRITKDFNAAKRDLKREGIKYAVTSTWRSSQYQAELCRCWANPRCRRANPWLYRPNRPGQSLHEAGLAVDISGVAAGPRRSKRFTRNGRKIVGIMKKHGFKWRYGLADPPHFEVEPKKAGYRSARQAIAQSQAIAEGKAGITARADKKPARGLQTAQIRGKG